MCSTRGSTGAEGDTAEVVGNARSLAASIVLRGCWMHMEGRSTPEGQPCFA